MLQRFVNYTYEILRRSVLKCRSNIISLSGGLDSTILAYLLKNRKPATITIITKNFDAKDLEYTQQAANRLGLNHNIQIVDINEIKSSIQHTIKILQNFNDIEIRNSIVMYLVLKSLKKIGYNSIITGDGADELFCGYNFFLNKKRNELQYEYNRILKIMHFPVIKLGKSLGIKIELPFLDDDVIALANKIPMHLKIRIKNNRKYGKWILRKSFEKKIPASIAWRNKSPIQEGSGTIGLTNFFDVEMDDNVFTKKITEIYKTDKIHIRSKESLHYYEVFRKFYDLHKLRYFDNACPNCYYPVKQFSKFCLMCGTFPI